MDFEAEINSLKDTLVVMAEIQRRQADVQRTQAERSAEHEREIATHEKEIAHIRSNLSEATDKLNALIEIVDGVVRKRPPESSTG